MWYTLLNGMVLEEDDYVLATPYDRNYVECKLIRKKENTNVWIAKDMEVPKSEIDKHIGDMSIIMLTEDMIKKIWRVKE